MFKIRLSAYFGMTELIIFEEYITSKKLTQEYLYGLSAEKHVKHKKLSTAFFIVGSDVFDFK